MARKKQVLGDGGMAIKTTTKRINQWHKTNGGIKLHQCNGYEPGYANKYQRPDISSTNGRFVKSPNQHQYAHAPYNSKNWYRYVIGRQMGQYPIIKYHSVSAFNTPEKGRHGTDNTHDQYGTDQ